MAASSKAFALFIFLILFLPSFLSHCSNSNPFSFESLQFPYFKGSFSSIEHNQASYIFKYLPIALILFFSFLSRPTFSHKYYSIPMGFIASVNITKANGD